MAKKTKSSLMELLNSLLDELFYSEEAITKKSYSKSKYYTNPFGGFLP